MIHFILLILGILGYIAVGRCVAYAIGSRKSGVEDWGVAIVLGVATISWVSFLWSFCGGLLGAPLSWGLTLLGGGGYCWIYLHGGLDCPAADLKLTPLNSPPADLVRTCQWLIGGLLISAFVQTLLTPQRFWDERAIFAIKAKVLWTDRSLESEALHHPDFVNGHPQYPLLIPLAEQHIYALLGGVHDRWSKAIFPLLYAGLVLAFTGVCARRMTPAWGWLGGLLLATIPVLMPYEYGFLSGQADAPVACMHGLAVLYLWDALQPCAFATQRRSMILAGCFAAAVAFTKDEGIAFLMVDVLAWGLAILLGFQGNGASAWTEFWRCRRWLDALIFAGIAGVLLVPWLVHRRELPDTTEMNYFSRLSVPLLIERLPTLRWSIPHLFSRMFLEWRTWGLHWWMALAAVVTHPGKVITRPQQFLVWNLLGCLAALLVAGMVAPAELEEHLGGSTHRYLMQLVPVALLLVMSQWGPTTEVA